MTGFLLRPLDWVSFGPPRSGSAGESHRRSTDIPPTPTTFQGIVRTSLLRAAGVDLLHRSSAAQQERDALVGGPERLPPGWQLSGPFITEVSRGVARPWTATPRFLLKREEGPPARARLLGSLEVDGVPTALNDLSPTTQAKILGDPGATTDPLGGWLSPRGLRWALSGRVSPWDPGDHRRRLPPFVKYDRVPGLAIDPLTGTAEDGMLFFGDVLRFAGLSGIAGWLSAPLPAAIPADALTRGDLATCGWKSRPAVLEPLPSLDPDWEHVSGGHHLPAAPGAEDSFFLTALTPIPAAKGPLLGSIEREIREHVALPPGVEAKVLAALTGKPRVIGGLAAASRRTRPNRSFWEAGSAFLFELRGGSAADRGAALQRLNNAHPLGSRQDASFGYGHTLVAVGEVKEGRT